MSWVSDFIHEILGYSESTVEQFVIKMAAKENMKTADDIKRTLVGELEFPEVPQTSKMAERLFQEYQRPRQMKEQQFRSLES